jgi:antitoxin (DNA-binding transcriptional repressor) of toxin-antitoxin stability system
MRRIGVREFKDHASALLNAEELLIVEKHGRPIGAYIPFQASDRAAADKAAAELAETLEAIYARTGMSEDELVAAFLQAS